MKTAIALVAALGLSAAMTSVTAQAQADSHKYEKGTTVTLQGCVVAAEKKDTWILTHVREWPIATSDMGRFGTRYYFLEKIAKDLRAHGGHTIQVTGKISDIEKSEMEIKPGESDGGMTVEIEGPGTNVVTTAENARVPQVIGALTGQTPKDIPITLLKVKVSELKMIAPDCTSTF